MEKIKVSIVGTGNVGSFLIDTLKKEVDIVSVYSRSRTFLSSNSHLGVVDDLSKLDANSNITIIAVSDDSIEDVSNQINTTGLVVHTSGSMNIDALKKHKRQGVLYPFQSISKGRKIDSKEIPFFIESNEKVDLKFLEFFCEKFLSNKLSVVNSEIRKRIHLSGVIANNFATLLFHEATKILIKNNIDTKFLFPLITETTSKFLDSGYHLSQTGPAKRGDIKIIQEHLDLIEESDFKEIYKLLSDRIKNNFKS